VSNEQPQYRGRSFLNTLNPCYGARSPDAALRRAIPAFNQDVRSMQARQTAWRARRICIRTCSLCWARLCTSCQLDALSTQT